MVGWLKLAAFDQCRDKSLILDFIIDDETIVVFHQTITSVPR
jgi:hypothetical protein